ncbi:hypothetical protein Ndes2526B_g08009 [Nannochloris sp. 'desiccata']|nr:hypothetical protein KSW81_002652 [Chlorella desiccata (nom. nud.)]
MCSATTASPQLAAMPYNLRSNGASHALESPVTSTENQPKTSNKSSTPLGKLVAGLPAPKQKGERGPPAKNTIPNAVAIAAALFYPLDSGTKKKKPLTLPKLLFAINKVFHLALVKVSPKENGKDLKETTLRRSCYLKDYGNSIPITTMGFAFEDLDWRNEAQKALFNNHINATGFSGLIKWLASTVLAEVENPGENMEASKATKETIAKKKFTELEKRALRIWIVGIDASQKVDEDLDYITTTTTDDITLTTATGKITITTTTLNINPPTFGGNTDNCRQKTVLKLPGASVQPHSPTYTVGAVNMGLGGEEQQPSAMDVDVCSPYSPPDIAIGASLEACTPGYDNNFEVTDFGALESNPFFQPQYMEDDILYID